jgi:primosomal protein N' (replication factor Y) (superfamily II helicase)
VPALAGAQEPAADPAAGAIARVQPITTARSLARCFDYLIPPDLEERVSVGSMLVVPFGGRRVLGVVLGRSPRSEVPRERLLAPLRLLDHGLPTELAALAEWIAEEYCSTPARALALVLPPEATRRLSGRTRKGTPAPANIPVGTSRPDPPELTEEQRDVLAPLLQDIHLRRCEPRLLHGVTGSGKTEVYLRATAAALAAGRSAIVLVPEIGLTPQIVARFVARFGDTVAVLHSGLTPGQRFSEWRRLREGSAQICVGPRSSVFAPVDDLGLLIVDEEHDASYKHEGDPRYDARDVACERARRVGAALVLGSATPRPETVARASVGRLLRRVDGGPLPAVRVLDMRGESAGLHPATVQALALVRTAGEKAIVLLNRRGWSNFLSCRSCGNVWTCPDCDVALVLHRAGAVLACHHCGHREAVPARCASCSSTSVARHGSGTERLAHELAALFDDGGFPVFRLDADIGEEGGAASVLHAFGNSPSGVLLGTQMVAKGHDFADVRLGVVLDADATLRFPDFRAEERTFALIEQLAGRVGRGGEGHVLVQTIAPEARAIASAAAHDGDGFLAGELERRRALCYPPFAHLIRVTCSAERAASAQGAAREIRDRAHDALPSGASMLGPATLFRLRGRDRRALVVKSPDRRGAVEALGAAVAATSAQRVHREVSFSVDVDPQ